MQTNLLEYLEATAPRLPRKTAYSDGTDSVSFAELLRASRAVGSALLGEQMALSSPGKGIAFTISLDSISSAVCHHADPSHHMQTTTLKEADFAMSENKQFALIAAVIPHGESDLVVDATRAAGARGGTMIRARALGTEEASRFFHITIQPEKEVVFTIVPMSIKKVVMQSICSRILEKSGEHGIVFSVPVDEALGLRMPEAADRPEVPSNQA